MGFVFQCLLCAGASRDRADNVGVEILVSQKGKEPMHGYHRWGIATCPHGRDIIFIIPWK